jgi:hypothetical protein
MPRQKKSEKDAIKSISVAFKDGSKLAGKMMNVLAKEAKKKQTKEKKEKKTSKKLKKQ